MSENKCRNCAHFHQHYALDQREIFQVYCGHCTFLRVRTKRPDSEICEKFVPAEPDEAAFANKEYLSKELLQYMLKLELLPEIKDWSKNK